MEKSLFIPLREEGLTTMKIRYDFKTGAVRLYAAKEWEKDFDFAQYNHAWWIDGIFTEDARYLNTKEVWSLFEKYGQKEYLEAVSYTHLYSWYPSPRIFTKWCPNVLHRGAHSGSPHAYYAIKMYSVVPKCCPALLRAYKK